MLNFPLHAQGEAAHQQIRLHPFPAGHDARRRCGGEGEGTGHRVHHAARLHRAEPGRRQREGDDRRREEDPTALEDGDPPKSPAKTSKADFVRARSHLSPEEIVEDAKAAGLKLDTSYVYNVRG